MSHGEFLGHNGQSSYCLCTSAAPSGWGALGEAPRGHGAVAKGITPHQPHCSVLPNGGKYGPGAWQKLALPPASPTPRVKSSLAAPCVRL